MLKKFSYTVKVVFQNNDTGMIDFVKKTFKAEIEYDDNSYNNDFYVNSYSVDNEMDKEINNYLKDKVLTKQDITIVSREVTTDDPYIDVFFKESESEHVHNDSPDIEATLKPILKKIITPQNFRGVILDKNTIQWNWDLVDLCAYRIYDDEGNIIKEIGVNTDTFIEGYLEEGQNYTRKISAFTANDESDCSEYITIATPKPEEKSDILVNFELEEKLARKIQEQKPYNGTLSAFKSGIGDMDDLKVIPMSDTKVFETFDFETYLEGIIKKYIKAYTKINFKYKVIATCLKKLDDFTNCDVLEQAEIYPVLDVGFKISGEACIPFKYLFAANISVRFKLKNPRVTPKPVFVDAISEDENCENKIYSTSVHDSLGYQFKKVRYIKEIPIKSSKENELILDILHYLKTEDKDIAKSIYETIEILAVDIDENEDKNVKIEVKENKIYLTCTQHKNIFKYDHAVKNKLFYSNNKTKIKLLNAEDINVYNYLGESYTPKLDYYGKQILPKYKITYDKKNQSDFYSIYNTDYDFFPIEMVGAKDMYVDLKEDYKSPSVIFQTHVEDKNEVIKKYKITDIFKDYFQKEASFFNFEEYELIFKRGRSRGKYEFLNNKLENKIMNENTTSIICKKNEEFLLKCYPMHTYQEVYVESPIYAGSVNGYEPIINEGDGKIDFIITAQTLEIPKDYLSPKFSIKIIKSDNNRKIICHFKNEIDTNITEVNGDVITFSSNDFEYTKYIESWKGPKSLHTGYMLNSIDEKEITINLKSPMGLRSIKELGVTNVKLQSSSLNPNVAIKPKYSYSGTSNADYVFKARIISPSQNAWSPIIHPGYYYINNNEYFFFANSKPHGEFLKKQIPIEKEFFINIKADINKKAIAKDYNVNLKTHLQLLEGETTDTTVSGEKIILDKYMYEGKRRYYNTGSYITKMLYFDDIIKNITIDWEQNGDILCYIQPIFHYEDFGEWIHVEKGVQQNLHMSAKTFRLKFVLSTYKKEIKKSINNKIGFYNISKYCENNSTNITINNNFIESKDKTQVASIDISGPFPKNNENNISNIKISIDSNIEFISKSKDYSKFIDFYLISYDDEKGEISTNITDKLDNDYVQLDKKSFGFLIKFKKDSKLKIKNISYDAILSSIYEISTPELSNISIVSKIPELTPAGSINKCILCKMPMDGKEHLLDDKSVFDIIYPDIVAANINNPSISKFELDIEDADVTLNYEEGNQNTLIKGTCNTIKTKRVTTDYIDINKYGAGYITPIPQLGYPIVLVHDTIGALKHVNFGTEEISLTNTEEIISDGKYAITLQYNDIDLDTVKIKNITTDTDLTFEKIINNIIYLNPNTDVNKGDQVSVKYKIKNSFTVDYNYNLDINTAKILVHLSEKTSKDELAFIKCFYQTEDSNEYTANELQLNPLYTDLTDGFIYITDKEYEAKNIEMYVNPKDFIANGKDGCYIYVKITDKYNNPVPNKPIQIRSYYGKIEFKSNITNISGIISAKYTAPEYSCVDTLTASCGDIEVEEILNIKEEPEDITMIVNPKEYEYNARRSRNFYIKVSMFNQNLAPTINAKITMIIEDPKDETNSKKFTAITDANGIATFENIKPFINADNDVCIITIMYNGKKEKTEIKVVK